VNISSRPIVSTRERQYVVLLERGIKCYPFATSEDGALARAAVIYPGLKIIGIER